MDDFDLQDFLPYMLNRAAEAASLEFQQLYKNRYGMLRTEWRVLFHLGRYGALTAKDICTRAGIHKTKVSRAVAALEARRFLGRKTFAQDRRAETLHLTPQGDAAFADLTQEARRFDRALTRDMSAEEEAILRRTLATLAKLAPFP